MCTNNVEITKDQERDALQQIKDIVDSLGPDSYIATAFKGVLDVAEENIDNDFSGNPVDHAYDLGVQLAERTVQVGQLSEERDDYMARAEAAEQQVIVLKAKLYDIMPAQNERRNNK